MIFHMFTYIFTIYVYFTNSRRDQLPVGLIAQLVEHCTGIAVKSWARIKYMIFYMFPCSFNSTRPSLQFDGGFTVLRKFPKVRVTTHYRDVCLTVVTLQKQVFTSFDNFLLGSISSTNHVLIRFYKKVTLTWQLSNFLPPPFCMATSLPLPW